jgi:O-antigen ligase
MKPLDLAAWCAALFLAANLFPHSVALRLSMLALGLALVVFTLVRAKAMHRPLDVEILPPLLVPILLWAAWAALSVTWSVEPYRSLKEFKNEVVYVFLGYWLCWVAAQAPGARRAFGTVLGGGAVLTCVVGLYGFAVPAGQPWLARLASGPGDQSSALLTLMPCALVAIWLAREEQAPRTLQRVLWALPPLFLAAAYATLNRTVWIGFAAEVAVMAALLLPRPEFASLLKLRRARILGGFVAVAFVGGVVLVALQVQEQRFGDNSVAAIEKDPRMEVWAAAVDTIKEHPIAGLGFGRGIDRQSLHEEFGSPLIWHAHNLILETAVEAGLPGAVLLLLLICATAYKGWALARNADPAAAAYGIVLLAVVTGMFARNMTDTLLIRQNALLYWGVAGLLLSLSANRSRRG